MDAGTRQQFHPSDHLSGDDLLSLLIESATNHALVTLDADGLITRWNAGAARLFGYRAREIIGQPLGRFHRPADQAAGRPAQSLAEALAHGRYEGEEIRVRKDGSEFPAEIVIYPLRRKSGELIGFAKIVRDITSHVELERASAASAAKSRLLAQLGHEFRTPLNAIIGFSEAMQQRIYGDLGHPRYASYIDDIHASGLHLLRLVESVLDLVRVDTDKVVPMLESVDLADIIAYVVRVTKDKAEARGISLISLSSGDFAEFQADDRMIRQCLINLVDNALKYSPQGTRVTISAERKGNWVSLAVADQGRGIAKDEIDRATEPFRQLGEDPRDRRDGVGLGLALVKSFCEAHGGSLMIESELGRGTRVSARFPYPRAGVAAE